MGLGAPALVVFGGLTIVARIWSAVRRVPTPFNDGPMSPPSRSMRWQRRQLLFAMIVFTRSLSEAFWGAEPLVGEAGVAGSGFGADTAMLKGVRGKRPPAFASSILHIAPSAATSTSR